MFPGVDKLARELGWSRATTFRFLDNYLGDLLHTQRIFELSIQSIAGRLGDLDVVLNKIHRAVTRAEKSYTFVRRDGGYGVRVLLPFATKGESCAVQER